MPMHHHLLNHGLASAPQLDELLPTKVPINITRLSNRSSVYTVAGDVGAPPNPPLFFEMDYGGIFPTVYSLWRFPELVAVRIATFSEVSPKVSCSMQCAVWMRFDRGRHAWQERVFGGQRLQPVAENARAWRKHGVDTWSAHPRHGAAERAELTGQLVFLQVLGGAQVLFLQGFAPPSTERPSWRANDTAVIVVLGNRYPLAVGIMECDIGQAKASGMKVCHPAPA